MQNSVTRIKIILSLSLFLYFNINRVFSQNEKALPAPINTSKFTEYAPSVSADGKTLVFESDRQGDWKLFESRSNGKNWSVPTAIPKINTTFFEKDPLGGPCLSYDGNLLFFSAEGKDSDGHEDIYYSIREKGGWSAPMNLGRPINSEDYEGYPSLSANGKYLYFSRATYLLGYKKDPQQRCYRLMRSERGADGKWQAPLELPNPVNLTCEKAPRIMPDGKTLLFSSIRTGGKGNFDIYSSELQENGTWTNPVPVNLLNTSGSDQFVAIPACGKLMYYVKGGDIYTATVPNEALATIQGYLTDSTTNYPLSTKILVSEVSNPEKIIAEVTSDPLDGRFSVVLSPKGKYNLTINEAGYYRKKILIDLAATQTCETFEQDFKLIPLGGKVKNNEELVKLSFLAIDSQTNLTVPAAFEAKEVSSGKSIALQYNPNTLQHQGEFRFKEDYSIEASMKNYKRVSISLRVDEERGLLPVNIIKLAPLSSNFTIKAYQAGTDDLLKDTKVTITEITSQQTVELKANPETGEIGINLLNGKQYKLVVSSENFEAKEQTITKSENLKDLSVKLLSKPAFTVNLLAMDLETGEPLSASFTVTSEKTGKIFKGNQVKAKAYFPVGLFQNDQLKVEVISEGFVPAKSLLAITNVKLGEQSKYNLKLAVDRYPLLIKVLDAETQKPIKEATVKITELKTSGVIEAIRTPANDFKANLKRSGIYELIIKAEDYVELPKQTLNKSPEGGVINLMLLKKKRLPVNFAFFDILTNKPLKATFSVRLEKEQKTFSFKDESEGMVKVAEREVFTVETSADGYKPKQSTFNMVDFAVDKKYSFNISLEKALFVLKLKVINKLTKEPVGFGSYNITDLTTKTNKTDLVKLPLSDATVSINSDNKYHLEINAEGYEKFEQDISKLTNHELICPLTPKPSESALILSAVDSTNGRILAAVFKLISAKTRIVTQGKTSESSLSYKLPLIETDSFLLETFVKGYTLKNENIAYTTLGKTQKHVVNLSRNFSVLSLKAYDTQDNKPLSEVLFSLIDAKDNKPISDINTLPNGECSAELIPGRAYIIKAKLAGYDAYESLFTANIIDVNLPIKMRSFTKRTLFLYSMDSGTKNKVSASFTIYDPNKEIIATGKTDVLREQLPVVLKEKINYTYEIKAVGYKLYEGKITADSSMKNAPIASWLVKEDRKLIFRVTDSQTRKILEKCIAKLTDAKSNQELTLLKNGNEYSAELSPDASYILDIESIGYEKSITRIDPITDFKKDISLLKTKEPLELKQTNSSLNTVNPTEKMPNFTGQSFEKIEKGKAIVLNNVYFEQGSFIMQKESYTELDKIVTILKANPQTKIEIDGHTDNTGDPRLNLALSENRAKVILNYLVSKRIEEARLQFKGYGGTKPVAPNDSEENKKKNRRVEIVGIQ